MGGVAFGALAVWIMCRVRGTSYALFADCVAPALLVAQALGRWGKISAAPSRFHSDS
jgi:prolipoprotein diacylglyceryltransferase